MAWKLLFLASEPKLGKSAAESAGGGTAALFATILLSFVDTLVGVVLLFRQRVLLSLEKEVAVVEGDAPVAFCGDAAPVKCLMAKFTRKSILEAVLMSNFTFEPEIYILDKICTSRDGRA